MSGNGIGRILLFASQSRDVYENLAREEFLFDNLLDSEACLLLYVNEPCIVIGKHQNPWRECKTDLVDHDLRLARRISGGGTVYHDEGNLNFSFLMPKRLFDRRRNLELAVRALSTIRIDADISSRYDLLAGGRKISGNAFCFRRERALHHGTLLIASRLERLRGALLGLQGITSAAVASNPQPVVNLAELYPNIQEAAIRQALLDEFVRTWAASAERPPEIRQLDETSFAVEEVRRLAARNRAWEWNFGHTPRFTVRIGRAGEVELAVEEGRVTAVNAEPDADLDGRIASLLRGVIFGSTNLRKALAGAPEASSQIEELIRWLKANPF